MKQNRHSDQMRGSRARPPQANDAGQRPIPAAETSRGAFPPAQETYFGRSPSDMEAYSDSYSYPDPVHKTQPNHKLIYALIALAAVCLLAIIILSVRYSSRRRSAPIISNSTKASAAEATDPSQSETSSLPFEPSESETAASETPSVSEVPSGTQFAPDSFEGKMETLFQEIKSGAKSWSSGEYQVGTELPEGYYCLLADTPQTVFQYAMKDANGAGIVAGSGRNRGYFQLQSGTIFSFEGGLLFHEEEAPPVTDLQELPEGMYSLGVDLPAGTYRILPTGKHPSYEILRDCSRVNPADVVIKEALSGESSVQLEDIGYIRLREARLLLDGKVSPQMQKLMEERGMPLPDGMKSAEATESSSPSLPLESPSEGETTPSTRESESTEATPPPSETTSSTPAPATTPTSGDNGAAAKQAALLAAKKRLDQAPYSRLALINQLQQVDGFSREAATYAADQSGANWQAQAFSLAKSYLQKSKMTPRSLMDTLVQSDGFQQDEAQYAIDSTSPMIWKEMAQARALEYRSQGFQESSIYQKLLGDHFTPDAAEYAAKPDT